MKVNEHELYHYGVLGMKWGVRRYQNADGTLTSAGRNRYFNADGADKKQSTDVKKKLTKQQKANIAIGVGSAVAIGGLAYVSLKQRKKIIEMGKEYTKIVAERLIK